MKNLQESNEIQCDYRKGEIGEKKENCGPFLKRHPGVETESVIGGDFVPEVIRDHGAPECSSGFFPENVLGKNHAHGDQKK